MTAAALRMTGAKAVVLFAILVGGVAGVSCSENLDAGGSCPLLCPQEPAPVKDTIIDAITFDTSIVGFPPPGFETYLLLANHGDTLDTRVILRYDSLPTTYNITGGAVNVTRIDSAYLRGIVPAADSLKGFSGPATIEAYDVTDAVDDTAPSSLAAQFTPGNFIGSLGFVAGDTPDTVTILLDTARVRSRILNGQSLRVGLKLVSTKSEEVRFESRQIGSGFNLIYHPDRDTSVAPLSFQARSATPTDIPFLQAFYNDFTITVNGGGVPPAGVLRVGGYPAQRVLLRFHLPPHIVDSSVVIRATLLLTQRRAKSAQAGDTVVVRVAPIIASSQLTDLREVLQFAGAPQNFPTDSLVIFPKDSARRELQIVNLVRSWRGQDTLKTPRLAALYLASENTRAAAAEFFSMEAPIDVRPQLRITYVTKVSNGRP